MAFELYAWRSPRDLDDDQAAGLVSAWLETGGDPAESPFEPSTDVGWFQRELVRDHPALVMSSDAVPNPTETPVWLSTADEPPARVVAIRVSPETPRDVLESIFGLATKHDLVLFDARGGLVHRPLEEMAAYASATFWPRGAIRAAVAGGVGGLVAVSAFLAGIPLLSGVLVLVGAFLSVMAVFTFVHEGRKAANARRAAGDRDRTRDTRQ
jgi:hypothetical protein